MNKVRLSQRLTAVAKQVPKGTFSVDVGCDHGFLSIYLVEEKIAYKGLATDVVPGPLGAAKEHIVSAGLEDVLETRLSDGLSAILKEEAEGSTLIIAGMGGPLILKILAAYPEVRDAFSHIIISPQSQLDEVREGIVLQGLVTIDEDMVCEDGKYYTIMHLIPKGQLRDDEAKNVASSIDLRQTQLKAIIKSDICQDELEKTLNLLNIRYGDCLLSTKHTVLVEFLAYEHGILKDIEKALDAERHPARYKQVMEDLLINRLAYKICTGVHTD